MPGHERHLALLAALIPSAGVGFLFWLVVKNMIEGDRKERLAHSQWEAATRSNAARGRPGHVGDNSGTAQSNYA